MTTILTEDTELRVSNPKPSTENLWLAANDVEAACGWLLKPEGMCKGDVCVPIPPGREADFLRGKEVNLAAFWNHMNAPYTATQSGDVWFLGTHANARNDALLSLEAPNFTLPDFEGNKHSLTDFRRKRILLITWASW